MKPNLNKRVTVEIRREHITEGACGDPNKCMIKLAIAEAIRVPHGYIKVDARGVRLTRRKDYREGAFLPMIAYKKMLAFDNGQTVEPFSIRLNFVKTDAVKKPASAERKAQINAARATRKSSGRPDKKYTLAKRLRGIAFTSEAAKELHIDPQ
jgi:hypothetical protein